MTLIDLDAEADRLTAIDGPDPSEVGKIDGTEDDFGDLQGEVADLLGIDREDDRTWERYCILFEDCADCASDMRALIVAVGDSCRARAL